MIPNSVRRGSGDHDLRRRHADARRFHHDALRRAHVRAVLRGHFCGIPASPTPRKAQLPVGQSEAVVDAGARGNRGRHGVVTSGQARLPSGAALAVAGEVTGRELN